MKRMRGESCSSSSTDFDAKEISVIENNLGDLSEDLSDDKLERLV